MTVLQILEEISLGKNEAEIYLFLLQHGPSSPTQIARGTNIKRPNIYEYVKTLENRGLIHYQLIHKKKLLEASEPNTIEELARQKYELIKSIIPNLKSISPKESFKSSITFYQGRRAMQELFMKTLNMKKKEFRGLWPATDMDRILGKQFMEKFIKERVKKGIPLRSLRDASKESLYDQETKNEKGKQLTQAAYLPEKYTFSLAMQIHDDIVAFYSSKKESYAFVVESKEFAEVMRMLYDIVWEHSGKLKNT